MSEQVTFSSVIRNKGFLNLWSNQIFVQLCYNALNFALLIWVFKLTDSNTALSALLFAVYLPAVIFGLFTGIIVDLTDRKKIILIINLLLAVCFFSLIFLKFYFPAILVVAFMINTLSQFYAPAEASAIPIIVKKEQLLIANSLFTITLQMSFLLGFGLAGPLMDHLGINMLLILQTIILLVAFALAFKFPSIQNKSDQEGKKLLKAFQKQDFWEVKEISKNEIRETMQIIRGKLPVLSSIIILAGVQVVVGVLAVLIPSFFERVINVDATNASYILILPLGVGMILGGVLVGKRWYKLPRRTVVGRAILVAGILFSLVGLAPLISPVIQYFPKPRPLPFFYQPNLSAILALGSFFLGMAMVSIMIPAQTVLQENTPEQDRGKVFSVLNAAMMGLSLIPVLAVGALADIFGTMPIFLVVGGLILICGIFALRPHFFFAGEHLPKPLRDFLGRGHWEKN